MSETYATILDPAGIIKQLNDLPYTFRRPGLPYTATIDAHMSGLRSFTSAIESVFANLDLGAAQFGWLDVIGMLFGIPRTNHMADSLYRNIIQETLAAWVGTGPSIEAWGLITLGQLVTVIWNQNVLGYTIYIPPGISTVQIDYLLSTLNRVRPAGVPFNVSTPTPGLYLDTVNYMGEAWMPGAYLVDPTIPDPVPNGGATDSAQPLLPDYFLSDPTLNPQLPLYSNS